MKVKRQKEKGEITKIAAVAFGSFAMKKKGNHAGKAPTKEVTFFQLIPEYSGFSLRFNIGIEGCLSGLMFIKIEY